jgi:cellulose synthase/poly-beta-1,6-N-acetylglucosamine synthase-like glycosyltransferase
MLILSGIYIVIYLILLTGYKRFISVEREDSEPVKISIIISARNEELTIRDCLASIKKLDYPDADYELIIIDDNSTDHTYEVAAEITKGYKNCSVVKAGEKSLTGKKGALLKGIEQSSFPFIIITDADCHPSSGWLRRYSTIFSKGYDFVFGPSPFYREKNFINYISCVENLKSQFFYFSLASLGLPFTSTARNMGFSREAFFKVGGYLNTQDTLSGDDDLLLREAVRNKLRIKAFFDKNAFVYSSTKRTFKEYLNQKARHTQSSLHYLLRNKIILAGWHLLNLFMVLSLVLSFINIDFIWLFIIKMIADIVVVLYTQKKFGYKFNLFEIFYLDIIYEIFIVINFLNANFRKIEWK